MTSDTYDSFESEPTVEFEGEIKVNEREVWRIGLEGPEAMYDPVYRKVYCWSDGSVTWKK